MPEDSPRLYLMLPAQLNPATLPGLLKAAMDAGDVACLLVETGAVPPEDAARIVAACRPLCARYETALLVCDTQLAKLPGVDGVHISGRTGDIEKLLDDAVKKFKPALIAGAGGLRSRHDAMSAGERDIDYVMFGEPAPDGYVQPFEQIEERTAWWAEIFNVPCVAYAPAISDVARLTSAGADFIAVRDAVWTDSRGPATAIADIMLAIRKAPVPDGARA